MVKKWRIFKLLPRNSPSMSPNERVKRKRPVPSQAQREQQLRLESFENTLSRKMKESTLRNENVDREKVLQRIEIKGLAPQETPFSSQEITQDLAKATKSQSRLTEICSQSNAAKVTKEKHSENDAMNHQSWPAKICPKSDAAKATRKKPFQSDSVGQFTRPIKFYSESNPAKATVTNPSEIEVAASRNPILSESMCNTGRRINFRCSRAGGWRVNSMLPACTLMDY